MAELRNPGENRMGNTTLLIQEQIQGAQALKELPAYSPAYKLWCNTTVRILREHFNEDYVSLFNNPGSLHSLPMRSSPAERRKAFMKRLDDKVQFLQEVIVEYNRFQNNPGIDISRATPFPVYDFHQEIKAVSLALFEDKYYAQAVEEAFKRVIKEVKRVVKAKTGENLDGDRVMNRAFGFSHQEPVIKFNQLQNQEDEDEQQGMMLLFKGIVGIRNKKAHDNVILDDPVRAIEYLSLASLLMRLLEQFSG